MFPVRAVIVLFLSAFAVSAYAGPDEEALKRECLWLERAIAREPNREDAFGMFMRGQKPKCQALLEALARGDRSVRSDALKAVVKELAELREVIDAEHGGPPPEVAGPTPDEIAREKVAGERSEVERKEAEKAAAEKAAAEKAAAEKAAAEKAAAEKAAAEKAARDAEKLTDKERKALAAAEKKAAEEAKKQAEREAKAQAAAEREAKKQAEREEKARAAAEKKAAEEARREEERLAKQRAKDEAEARRLVEEAEREAQAQQREEAKKAAELLVDAELAEAEKEKQAEAERLRAEAERKQLEDERAAQAEAERKRLAATKNKGGGGALDGTWEQPATKVLDKNVKRTLNLITRGGKIEGELYEEVWFAAPSAWIDTSCDGNNTFRMVTTARVGGEVEGKKLVLWRDPPRVLTCTCGSRCIVESRRRGLELAIGPSGAELADSSGVFVRPGTKLVVAPTADKAGAGAPKLGPEVFGGAWETQSFKQRDRKVVQRIELEVTDGRVVGIFVERSSQALPLQSWADRFCDGSQTWEWVTQWKVEGKPSGGRVELKAKEGAHALCTCPSKCTKPKDKMTLVLDLGATGQTLQVDGILFERR